MTDRQPAEVEIVKQIDENLSSPTPLEYGIDEKNDYDQAYLAAPKSTRFYRGVLFQMILFGTLSFVGPSLNDAISNLGGGGLKDPDLANLAQALSSTCTCLVALFGGPIINKIGIKYACTISGFSFFLTGSGFYVNIKYGVQWYLLLAKIVIGVTNGFVYVAESTAMLTYPRAHERGKYIGIWSAMRNSGGILGGAISVGTNYKSSGAGAVSRATYLIFLGFECSGPIWAFLLTPTRKVRRSDGQRVPQSKDISWKKELLALWGHFQHKRTWIVALPSFYSFFFLGTFSTYLATHFSVRARALSSLISTVGAVGLALLYGRYLDSRRFSRHARVWWGMGIVLVPQVAAFIWIGIEWHKYPNKVALDYKLEPGPWARAYFPYLIMFIAGFCFQIYLYWILAAFSNDLKAASRVGGTFRAFETAGQATAFGLVSKSYRAQKTLYFNAALMVPAFIFLLWLVKLMPEEPSEVDDLLVGTKVGEEEREIEEKDVKE
ncbi:hypothetical protein CI109_105903 [Kwoniella shandongensis]|uniref:Uncharacterized protein n=1 Tax=Kwoniella shandongensis TaxID=1734106 RepID=A0A5M6BQJ9_9TREE|nr:uncharacterized protein CI109_006667 [Kwoniella shandongensis]KAA5525027.1 hypothetical protein CI109_006667 [Kwoniella shandongensis]